MRWREDPWEISRALAERATRLRRAEHSLKTHGVALDPFAQQSFPGKTLFDSIQESEPGEILREPLLHWTFRLLSDRIQWPWQVEEERILREEVHEVPAWDGRRYSLRVLRQALLGAIRARARIAAEASAAGERRLGAHRREACMRRVEIARRLGAEHPSQVDGSWLGQARVVELAELALQSTEELTEALSLGSFWDFLEQSLAWEASEAWPARLQLQTVQELTFGAELPCEPDAWQLSLPERLNPMSFVVAVTRAGQSWAEANAPRDVPFVSAYDPLRWEAFSTGHLWALWCADPLFLKKRLQLSSGRASEQGRAISRALLLHLRKLAASVLLQNAIEQGCAPAWVGEWGPRLFQEPISVEQWCGRWKLGPDLNSEFLSFCTAWARNVELREQYEEDYFSNPRFWESSREELHAPCLKMRRLLERQQAEWFGGEAGSSQNETEPAVERIVRRGLEQARLSVHHLG